MEKIIDIQSSDKARAIQHLEIFLATLTAELPQKAINEIYNFGFVAGGAIRSALLNEPIKDYDIFFSNAHSADDAAAVLDEYLEAAAKGNIALHVPFKRHFRTENAHSFILERGMQKLHIQLVKKFYGDPSYVTSRFDYTNSMAYYRIKDATLVIDPRMLDAIKHKKLVFNPECYSPTHSVGRAAKFIKKGWSIDKESLQLMAYAVGKEAFDLANNDKLFTTDYPDLDTFKGVMRSGGGY